MVVVKGFDWNFDELGPFGDFLAGSTVPLFTLVSSIGVILTLRMQQQQMKTQNEETEQNRKVMIEQGKTMALQRFESTFFSMLNLHNEIIKSLFIQVGSEHTVTDRKTFPELLNKLRRIYGTVDMRAYHINRLVDAFVILNRDFEYMFGPYFRNLTSIIQLIDGSDVTDNEKLNYIRIVKAQLTYYELAMLMYYGISDYGDELLPLMQKYRLLENLTEGALIGDGRVDIELFKTFSPSQRRIPVQ